MSYKLEQFTADIERGVRDVLSRGLQDPRVSGLITVTGVRVLQDLSRAYIDVSILPAERQELCFHGITAAASYIRREVSNSVRARVLPEFVFRLDTKAKKEAAILRGLEQIRADRRARGLPEEPQISDDGEPTIPPDGTDPTGAAYPHEPKASGGEPPASVDATAPIRPSSPPAGSWSRVGPPPDA